MRMLSGPALIKLYTYIYTAQYKAWLTVKCGIAQDQLNYY